MADKDIHTPVSPLQRIWAPGLRRELTLWFLALALIPLLVIAFLVSRMTERELQQQISYHISATAASKANNIKGYFTDFLADLQLEAGRSSLRHMFTDVRLSFEASQGTPLQFVASSEWQSLRNHYGKESERVMESEGFADLLTIDHEGNVLLSFQEGSALLGANLLTGKYAETLLGKSCRTALQNRSTAFADFQKYDFLPGEMKAFAFTPVTDNNGSVLGLLAVPFSLEKIDAIVKEPMGLGESEAAYLIGSDLKMRSYSRRTLDATAPLKEIKTDEAILFRQHHLDSPEQGFGDEHSEHDEGSTRDEHGAIRQYIGPDGIEVLGTHYTLNIVDIPFGIFVEIERDEAYAAVRKQQAVLLAIVLLTIFIVTLVATTVTARIVKPIVSLSGWAHRLGLGELSQEDIHTPDNEIGELNYCIKQLTRSFAGIADVCDAIARGDLGQDVEIRSDRDRLGHAVNTMAESLRGVVQQASAVAEGNYSTQLEPRSDKDELGIALQDMTRNLLQMDTTFRKQSWLESGAAELNNRMRGEQAVAILGRNIIEFLAHYLEAQLGTFYLVTDDKLLHLTASYAYSRRKNLANVFTFGEGIVGQAALENDMIVLENIPDNYFAISSGLGQAVPSSIVVIPFLYEEKVKGVMELASFKAFSEEQIHFLQKMTEPIGIAVNTAQSRDTVVELLDRTQEQAEELQVQQEELRQANEELEEQTTALKTSKSRLQEQQEELRQTNEELQEQASLLEIQKNDIEEKNLTLEKTKEDLEKKAEELTVTGKYKSEFLANMSHELRTPLNSIMILSRLLAENKEENLNAKQVEYASTVHASGNELLKLINEVLDLAKVEAGKMKLQLEDVALVEINENMVSLFQPIAREKNLQFMVSVADNLPEYMHTDRQRLGQAIKNLLSNAFKFTKEGSVSLAFHRPGKEVVLKNSSLIAGETIAISVRDTGIGIPKNKQEVVFEAFQQVDGTTSREFGGTGLGLSITKEIVHLLGGEVQLTGQEEEGCTFTLYLPEVLSAREEDAPGTPAASAINSSPSESLENSPAALAFLPDDRDQLVETEKSILIIEDDRTFALLLQDLARKKEFKTLMAGDGESGLECAASFQPSAIILDVGLPDIDGWTVMSRLKEDSRTRSIPVHFVTGADKELEALKSGAVSYLTKPVQLEELQDVFDSIMESASRSVKHVLLVMAEEEPFHDIVALLAGKDIAISRASQGAEACSLLHTDQFDCLIVDPGLADFASGDLLPTIKDSPQLRRLPLIMYCSQEPAGHSRQVIDQYAESLVIKEVGSMEKLLDEATLFLHRVEADLPLAQQRKIKKLHNKEGIFRNKKILLVDDDMRNVFALSSVLEEKDMHVLVRENGKEALSCLAEHPDVDLVLMDMMMPEMDGYEAIRQIRAQEKFTKLPIIALTAKAMKQDRGKCIEAGANDYMAKPLDSDKLLSMCRVWLCK